MFAKKNSQKELILIQRSSRSKGGLEKHGKRIEKALLSRGYRVTKLTETCDPDAIVIPLYAPLGFLKLLEFDIRCNQWCKKHPSIPWIFSMERTTYQSHMRLGNGIHRSYLAKRKEQASFWKRLSFYVNPLHQTLLSLEKRAFQSPYLKKILTNSQMVRSELLKYYPLTQATIDVLHNGVEWQELSHPFSLWQEKKELFFKKNLFFLKKDSPLFLFVGHNYKRKGFLELLEGLKLLKDRSWQLLVLGKDKQMGFYQDLIKKQGFEKKIHFFGNVENPLEFYQIADVIVIPSIYDPFANVTIEALAMGLFVITSKGNGGKEVLTEKSGIVIDDLFDPFSVKKALETGLEKMKTEKSATMIRNSISHLDFSLQLPKVIEWLENF